MTNCRFVPKRHLAPHLAFKYMLMDFKRAAKPIVEEARRRAYWETPREAVIRKAKEARRVDKYA